ncbi:MAG: Swarming motility protein SwrC [Elusimicrobia bacterium]|nr:Swarming motility protein SwrC [Elusimicrobiota bacterium]
MTVDQKPLGISGRMADYFIKSKLTILVIVASLLIGIFATVRLPREEEPQINVPMFDIFVPFPGASAKEVEERIVTVGERRLWEIPGVEYIYSTSEPGHALFIVRFKVGTNPEEAMTRIYTKTFAHVDSLAVGVGQPLIKPRSIDDVPILTVTLSGENIDSLELRRMALILRQEISHIHNVSETQIIGGKKRQFLIHFDPEKLKERRLTVLELLGIVRATNRRLPAGHYNQEGLAIQVDTDAFIRSADDLKQVVVGVSSGRPVMMGDVATITDGPDEGESFVSLDGRPAVTVAVSKRRGANATHVSHAVLSRIDEMKSIWATTGVQLKVTRDYGETAKEKSDELLFHVLLATFSVTLLIALALGIREALVVLIAIPVTLALTLAVYFLSGYTLNRITLFALIFSIGILVDDAIVVVENIHRHYVMRDGRSLWRLAVEAVDEVGNPTLLATFAVIAAILPMAFVSGLMGPYMRPIPVGASISMLFSVVIAFVVSPWAFAHLLEWWSPKVTNHEHKESWLDHQYKRLMGSILNHGKIRWLYFIGMVFLLFSSISLIYFKLVTVKMLPFDNKNEFEVVVTLPEGSAIDKTKQAIQEMSVVLKNIPEVLNVTSYVGAAAPYNFNGLVRHYFLRERPHQADLVVNLKRRQDRERQSHDIAKEVRGPLLQIAKKYNARIQVAEVPPGPPVLSTLVFEIYGPAIEKRREIADRLKKLLEATDGIVDVDTYVPDPQPLARLKVDRNRATLNGIPADQIAQTVGIALYGHTVDLAHLETEKEPVEIRLRLAEKNRRGLGAVRKIPLLSRNGTAIPIGDLTTVERISLDDPIYHKNLQPVSYVIADVAGRQESPIYAILELREKIQGMASSMGVELKEYFAEQPHTSSEYALKWDGEWQVTYEVFRDLGIAFALVLVLIYILVVGWFKSFTVPFVIMIPIPLTLVGILPAHWLMGAFFTATSMIGFIAGAGIVVRNSIILVDFIQLRQKEGMPLKEAVIDAGAVRFRPMLLTAAAVVVGAGVILFDPIFQGLAVSLMAGEVASTILSRTAVPVLYYLLMRQRQEKTL